MERRCTPIRWSESSVFTDSRTLPIMARHARVTRGRCKQKQISICKKPTLIIVANNVQWIQRLLLTPYPDGLVLDLLNSKTAPALRQCLRVNCGDSAGNLCFSVKGPALQKVTGLDFDAFLSSLKIHVPVHMAETALFIWDTFFMAIIWINGILGVFLKTTYAGRINDCMRAEA